MQALNILLQYFIDFLIWMIKCEPNEGIVRTTFGKNPKQYMKPGPYLRIPIIHDITSINITEQVLETPPQSIGLDDKNFLVTPLVRYKVVSPIDAVFKAESWERSLEAAIAKATYKFFQKNQNKNEKNQENPPENLQIGPLPSNKREFRGKRYIASDGKRFSVKTTPFMLNYASSPLFRTRREQTERCASESAIDIVSAIPGHLGKTVFL